MVETIKTLADVTGQQGAAVAAFVVLMALVIYQTVASSKRAAAREKREQERADAMLKRIIDGDGADGASIHKVLAATNSAVTLAKAADEKADQAITEVHAVRAEVVKLRTDGCSQLAEHRHVLAAGEAQ